MTNNTNSLKLVDLPTQVNISAQAISPALILAEANRETLKRLELYGATLNQCAAACEFARDGTIIEVNENFCRLSGYERADLIGQTCNILNSGQHDSDFWRALHNCVAAGRSWQGEVSNRRKDGTEFWLHQTSAAMLDDDGEVTAYFNVGIDITETKSLKSQSARNGQLAQLGQLTATVAHEIRNPLGAVKTATYVLGRRIQEFNKSISKAEADVQPLDVSNQLQRIGSGISRCDRIISELLDFTRNRPVSAKTADLDEWLAKTVDEESKTVPPSVQFAINAGLEDTPVPFDPDQLRRVIVNLVSNASEAMVGKAGDTNAITTEDPRITLSTRSRDGFAEITVEDNGPGISPENLRKIREPLFTTKSFGVGLGIPAIEKILKNHGGSLEIESTEGAGTTMTAKIPLTSTAAGGA